MAIVGWKAERDNGVSTVQLEIEGQPVISLETYRKLIKALINEGNREDTGAVLLSGPPEKFFFGLNLQDILALNTDLSTRGQTALVQDLLNELEGVPAVLICALDGTCFGGGLELLMAFHIALATPSSAFGLPEIKVGAIPSFGGTQRLPRIIGRNRAIKVLLTGEIFSAQMALEWGLIAGVLPREKLRSTAEELARHLAGARSRPAVTALLRAVLGGLDISLESGLSLESRLSSHLAGGQDLEEGVQAFFEKRSPRFPSTRKP
jgi:enoyl-CoA hydratase/carnithine racemase